MPVKRAGQIPAESETRMLRMFLCPSEGGVCAIELRERGVGVDQMNRRKDHKALPNRRKNHLTVLLTH
jgi:hypothetical protein